MILLASDQVSSGVGMVLCKHMINWIAHNFMRTKVDALFSRLLKSLPIITGIGHKLTLGIFT
jgi:hypothetical protein